MLKALAGLGIGLGVGLTILAMALVMYNAGRVEGSRVATPSRSPIGQATAAETHDREVLAWTIAFAGWHIRAEAACRARLSECWALPASEYADCAASRAIECSQRLGDVTVAAAPVEARRAALAMWQDLALEGCTNAVYSELVSRQRQLPQTEWADWWANLPDARRDAMTREVTTSCSGVILDPSAGDQDVYRFYLWLNARFTPPAGGCWNEGEGFTAALSGALPDAIAYVPCHRSRRP